MDKCGDMRDAALARLRSEVFGQVYSVREVADILGVTIATVQRYIRTGLLAAYKIGREYQVSEEALRVYADDVRQCTQKRSPATYRREERLDPRVSVTDTTEAGSLNQQRDGHGIASLSSFSTRLSLVEEWVAHLTRSLDEAAQALEQLQARVVANDDVVRKLQQRVLDLEADRNRQQVAAFVEAVICEYGLNASQIADVAAEFNDATCGSLGTFKDVDSLETAVRTATEQYLRR